MRVSAGQSAHLLLEEQVVLAQRALWGGGVGHGVNGALAALATAGSLGGSLSASLVLVEDLLDLGLNRLLQVLLALLEGSVDELEGVVLNSRVDDVEGHVCCCVKAIGRTAYVRRSGV